MKKNIGSADRILRLVLAVVIGFLFWQNIIGGIVGYVLLGFAGVYALSSFISFCPLYAKVGIDTLKVKP